MRRLFSERRNIEIANKLPIVLNAVLLALGVFILISMSVVWGVFEEFTAFTDYTQDWIEFNFFLHYWDRLTISRVYLAFIFIYGAVILAIASAQIHGYRKNKLSLLYFAPMLLVFVAVVSILASICWLIVTAVNHNEGFLATGGFIFERMRFKGNVWKDLKYREQSWRIVTMNQVPEKAPILKTWVHQRERDFDCCGWDSFMDYKAGGFVELPESCCKRKSRTYGCGANYLTQDITSKLNVRGCKDVMYEWYRRGFGTNIAIAILGILVSAFEFFLYSFNRRHYFKFMDRMRELKSMKIPMERANSKASISTPVTFKASDERPRVPLGIPMRNFYNRVDDEDADTPTPVVNNNSNNRSKLYEPRGDDAEYEYTSAMDPPRFANNNNRARPRREEEDETTAMDTKPRFVNNNNNRARPYEPRRRDEDSDDEQEWLN